jgi:hypothetical protein
MRPLRYFCILLFLAVLVFARQGLGREKTRITDIIPKDQSANKDKASIGLYVYVFELNRNRYSSVFDVLGDINDVPIEYKDFESFAGNGLVGCGGDTETWPRLAQILVDSKAELVRRTIVYISEDISDDVVLTVLDKSGSVSYRQGGSDDAGGIGLPAGNVSLRFNTQPLIGLKQIRKLNITPVYKAQTVPDKKQTSGKKQPALWEFPFSLISFDISLRPGQFVCIAPDPAKFPQAGPEAIGQMIFCSNKPKPVVRICLIACSLIND